MVKADGPTAVGVPESTPLALRVRPSGKVPLVSANVYGAVPPVAVKIWLYGVPITGVVSEDGEITIETDAVAVPLTAMVCVTELLFRLLSVSTNDSASEPVVRGWNSIRSAQFAAAASEKLLVQSVELPVTWGKSVGAVIPGATADSAVFPKFPKVTVCGLSLLVVPSAVLAKLKLGTVE